MSIDTESHLIVGLHASAWENTPLKTEGYDDLYDLLVEFLELDSFSPYFDCGYDQCFYGYSVASGLISDMTEVEESVQRLSSAFKKVTGKDSQIFVINHIF